MIIQKRVKDLIKRIADDHGLHEDDVQKIVYSYFGLLTKTMKDAERDDMDSFKNVRFMYFGIFAVKRGRLRKLNELRKKKNENI